MINNNNHVVTSLLPRSSYGVRTNYYVEKATFSCLGRVGRSAGLKVYRGPLGIRAHPSNDADISAALCVRL